jgi:dynein heavy chain 2
LSKIDEKVADLKVTFGKTTAEAEKLKLELQRAEEKIHKASVLLEKLAGENGRWQASLEEIQRGVSVVPSQALMASAFLNYLSDKDEGMRSTKVATWCQILGLKSFSLASFLSDESEILEYVSEGLPSDQLSIENAIIALHSRRCPLVVDPNFSLSQFIISRLKKNKQVEVISSQEKKIVSLLELGIRFGKTLIISEVDNIDSLYYNILRRDLKRMGPRMIVSVGDKSVDWSEQFKLIFLSRNQSLKLEPPAAALVSRVENQVTSKGLEEKLLSLIINDQQPGLEQKRRDCLEKERLLKIELSKVEKKLLEELANSSGNILENIALITSLDETKTKASAISNSLAESNKLKESLERERGAYQPHAVTGTKIFLLLRTLTNLSPMYAFSLGEYTKVFIANLKNARPGISPKELTAELDQSLFKGVYIRFSYALQKKDILTFALHLLTQHPSAYQPGEMDFLLDRIDVPESKVSLPSWANSESVSTFSRFCAQFPNVAKGLKFEKEEWRQWFSSPDCEKTFPAGIILRPMQRVLLVKVFREDRLPQALEDMVCQAIGLTSLNETVFSIQSIYATEQSKDTPILFVTSVGSDPSKEIEDFAFATVGKEKFTQISMGGGQNEITIKALEQCAADGTWLCLKNLHLVPNFLSELEKTLNLLELKDGFKLLLTTEETPKFPRVLLESCFKVNYEAPPGLKMNVERLYSTISSQQLKQLSPEEARLTYMLAVFHAILQERKTYIPQGWSKHYEFSLSDFKSGSMVLETVMTDHKIVDWPGLYGLFENAIYGGRIDRLVDLDVLRAYLETTFNEKNLKSGHMRVGPIAPTSNDIKDHHKAIAQLPEENRPSYFGLPDCFQTSVMRLASQQTLAALKILTSPLSSTSQKSEGITLVQKYSVVSPYISLWKSNP